MALDPVAQLDRLLVKGTLPVVGTLLGNRSGEFRPIRTGVCIGLSFLISWTRLLGNAVTQNLVAAPFFSI